MGWVQDWVESLNTVSRCSISQPWSNDLPNSRGWNRKSDDQWFNITWYYHVGGFLCGQPLCPRLKPRYQKVMKYAYDFPKKVESWQLGLWTWSMNPHEIEVKNVQGTAFARYPPPFGAENHQESPGFVFWLGNLPVSSIFFQLKRW